MKGGYAETTIKGYSKRLKILAKHVNLDNPEAVKSYIAAQNNWSNAYKESCVNAYSHYVREHGLSWEKPVYKRSRRLPNVPTTERNETYMCPCQEFLLFSDVEGICFMTSLRYSSGFLQ